MIRLSFLFVYILSLSLYAVRDWYVSLCGLIALLAVVEHPDMPKSLFGLQGLNPWNMFLLVVVVAWLVSRRRERLVWDMPRPVNVMLLAYLGVVLVGFGRMMANRAWLPDTTATLVSEYLINTLKWVVPGLLLYDGCRTRRRFLMGLCAVLAIYVLLSLLVIRWMPLGAIRSSGDTLEQRSAKILVNEIGYHRVNLSVMLAGASWALLSARGLAQRFSVRSAILFAALAGVFAQALTGGRAGYATWIGVGVVLGAVRWRHQLLALPLVLSAVLMLVPAARERMLQGFTEETLDTSAYLESQGEDDPETLHAYTISAGRTLIWPYVVDKILDGPWVGYGREAMVRTGLTEFLYARLGESFPHPHNAYLQWLLDNGVVGFLLTMPFYATVVALSFSLFRDSRSPVFVAAGGTCLALVLALLIGSIGSQTFYPREGAVGMWAAIGLMLRVFVERQRAIRLARAEARGAMSTTQQTLPPDSRAAAGEPGGAAPSALRHRVSLDSLLWTRQR